MKNLFGKCDQIRHFPADLVTFTEEIPNGKLYFLRSEFNYYSAIWIFTVIHLATKLGDYISDV